MSIVYAVIERVPDDSSWGCHEEIGTLFASREAAQAFVEERRAEIDVAKEKEKRVEARFGELLAAEGLRRWGVQTDRHRRLKEAAFADVGITEEEYSSALAGVEPVRVEEREVR